MDTDELEKNAEANDSSLLSRRKWHYFSATREAENIIMASLKSANKRIAVPVLDESAYIHTFIFNNSGESNGDSIIANERDQRVPMVLVHGFASGSAFWCKNVDELSYQRTVYAFDLLGFGRSSRVTFPKVASEVERLWVDSIENWRQYFKIERFIFVAHSLGGYIATAYALKHPRRIAHLVLVDPWGFTETCMRKEVLLTNMVPQWLFNAGRVVMQPFKPLSLLRLMGRLGRRLMDYFRSDLHECFHNNPEPNVCGNVINGADKNDSKDSSVTYPLPINSIDGSIVLDYLFSINMRCPSGEDAFRSLCGKVGCPLNPMIDRIATIDHCMPITFIYGSRSWMDTSSGFKSQTLRPNSYVSIEIIEGAGHQVFVQMSKEFNHHVNNIAHLVDQAVLPTHDDIPDYKDSRNKDTTNVTDDDNGGGSDAGDVHNSRARRHKKSQVKAFDDSAETKPANSGGKSDESLD